MVPANLPLTLYRGVTFGPIVLTALQADNVTPIDLKDWVPYAKVRKSPSGPVIIDLLPVININDAPHGVITIPVIADENTESFISGVFVWDLLLQRPTGEILGPFLAGSFTVATAVSRA